MDPTTPTSTATSSTGAPAAPDLSDPSSILLWLFAGVFRHFGTLAAGWLIKQGFADQSSSELVIAAIVALCVMAWSAGSKILTAKAHQLALSQAQQTLTPNQTAAVPKAADVPAPQPPVQPSPAPTSAPSASESGTAGDVQLLPIAEHPHIDVLKEKYGADANGNFPPGSKLSGVMTLVKVGLPLAPDASSSSSSSSLSSLGAAVVTAFVIAGIFLSGCATDTGNPQKDKAGRVTNAILSIIGRDVTNEVVYTVANLGTQAAQGQKIDLAWSAQQALYQQGPTLLTSADVQSVINAATGNQLPTVATAAAKGFDVANPQTQADRDKVVTAIAQSITTGAQISTEKISDGKSVVPASN